MIQDLSHYNDLQLLEIFFHRIIHVKLAAYSNSSNWSFFIWIKLMEWLEKKHTGISTNKDEMS